MTARAARLGVRWAFGVLLAVLVSLSVLAHHELMVPMSGSGVSMSAPMTASAPAAAGHGDAAMAPQAVGATSVSVAAATMTCGSEAVCSAAGVASPPLPAALPQATSAVAPAHSCGPVNPQPTDRAPPPPADTTSVLRI